MHEALVLARQAYDTQEVPVGAVVVFPEGEIIGQGYNAVERVRCQMAHAEARAIEMACARMQDWRLERCTLYVTLEPCMMCVSLAALSRIERVVYGAESPLFGYRLDKEGVLQLYTNQIKNITAGVCAEESSRLLQDFFRRKREKRGTCE